MGPIYGAYPNTYSPYSPAMGMGAAPYPSAYGYPPAVSLPLNAMSGEGGEGEKKHTFSDKFSAFCKGLFDAPGKLVKSMLNPGNLAMIAGGALVSILFPPAAPLVALAGMALAGKGLIQSGSLMLGAWQTDDLGMIRDASGNLTAAGVGFALGAKGLKDSTIASLKQSKIKTVNGRKTKGLRFNTWRDPYSGSSHFSIGRRRVNSINSLTLMEALKMQPETFKLSMRRFQDDLSTKGFAETLKKNLKGVPPSQQPTRKLTKAQTARLAWRGLTLLEDMKQVKLGNFSNKTLIEVMGNRSQPLTLDFFGRLFTDTGAQQLFARGFHLGADALPTSPRLGMGLRVLSQITNNTTNITGLAKTAGDVQGGFSAWWPQLRTYRPNSGASLPLPPFMQAGKRWNGFEHTMNTVGNITDLVGAGKLIRGVFRGKVSSDDFAGVQTQSALTRDINNLIGGLPADLRAAVNILRGRPTNQLTTGFRAYPTVNNLVQLSGSVMGIWDQMAGRTVNVGSGGKLGGMGGLFRGHPGLLPTMGAMTLASGSGNQQNAEGMPLEGAGAEGGIPAGMASAAGVPGAMPQGQAAQSTVNNMLSPLNYTS